MTTKKITDYIEQEQQAPIQNTEKTEYKPTMTRIQFRKETEFKETPIGKIPKNWKVVKLSNIARIIMGQSPPSETYNVHQEGLPFLQGKEEFGLIYPKLKLYTTQPIKIAEQGDILIAVRAPVGDVNIAPFKMCIGRGLAALRFDETRAHNLFYFYYLQYIKQRIESLSKGTTFKAITKEDLENLIVSLPRLEEQVEISRILYTIDSAIDRVRGLIERAERLKKGLMQELLTKGIGHTEFKETPIGKIPKEWRVIRLGEVCKPVKEIVEPRSSDTSSPYVGLEHIEPGRFFLSRWGTTKEVISSKYRFSKGEILYGRLRPYLDKCVLATTDGICSTDFIVIRANTSFVLPEYIVAVLHSERFIKYAISTMRGTNHPRTSWESISRYLLPLPPISEQAVISNILFSIDLYIDLLKSKHNLLVRIKKGLMDILLTGKIRAIAGSSEGVSSG